MTPDVSVVMPVHDGAAFLPQAIATIDAQGAAGLEIVLVDDGSTDATPAFAAALAAERGDRVQVLRTEQRGPAAARNAGIAAARGSAIALLDVDDLWPAGRLAALRAPLDADPTLDAVVGKIEIVFTPKAEGVWDPGQFRKGPVFFPHLGAGLFRPALFGRVGTFDETMRFGEDVDWYMRVLESAPRLRAIPDVVLQYRLHDANMTTDREAVARATKSVVTQSMLRRRRAGHLDPVPKLADFLAEEHRE